MFLQWIQSHLERTYYNEKKNSFFPTSPACRANFSFNCSIATVRGKIGSTCGWRGGKGFFYYKQAFQQFRFMSSSRWIHNNVKRRRETLIIEFCPPEISKGYYYIYYFFKLKASCFLSLLYTKNETQNLNCKLSSLFNFLRTIIFLVPSMTDS